MSNIKELISKVCPDGVEYKKLGELCSIITKQTGFDYSNHIKDKLVLEASADNVPYIQTKFFTGKNFDFNTDYYVPLSVVQQFPKITLQEKCLLFSIVGASIGNVGLYPGDRTSFLGGAICVAKVLPQYSVDYLFYCIEGYDLQRQILSKIKGAGQATITVEDIRCFEIPVPPIEVQEEIVHILDKFTALEVKLQMELEARKKQYQEYLNRLMEFSSSEEIKYMSVGELFEIKNGLNKEKEAFGKGKPIINFTDVFKKRYLVNGNFTGLVDVNEEEIERYSAKKGDVFFTRTSETREDVGMSSTLIEDVEGCVFSGFVLRARPLTDLLLPKFCAYYFATRSVRKTITQYASFTTRATTTGPKLSKIMVPILPVSEQQQIIDILDRMDAICNDHERGLPAEIEARHKQYEYYRDKLLTFKRKEA